MSIKPQLQKHRSLLLAVIILFQLLILTGMVLNSYLIIHYGEKIVLRVEPVDPRSLFQGDYVTLGYSFNTLDLTQTEHDFDSSQLQSEDRVYLSLLPRGETWTPGLVTLDADKVKDKVYLQGKVLYISDFERQGPAASDPQTLHASWGGIEKFFVPEGKGKEIEAHILQGEVYAQIAIYKGRARVTGLINK